MNCLHFHFWVSSLCITNELSPFFESELPPFKVLQLLHLLTHHHFLLSVSFLDQKRPGYLS